MSDPREDLPFEFSQRWDELHRDIGGPDGGALDIETAGHLEQRDRDLENFLATVGGAVLTLDLGEGAAGTGYTRSFPILSDSTLETVVGKLDIADGSTATIAEVVRNGVSLVTLTIPAGDNDASVPVGEPFEVGDDWQMRVTQVGTSSAGLSYHGKFN